MEATKPRPPLRVPKTSSVRYEEGDDAVSQVGIVVMLIVGILCAVAPRLGWTNGLSGPKQFAIGFAVTAAVSALTILVRRQWQEELPAQPSRDSTSAPATPSARGVATDSKLRARHSRHREAGDEDTDDEIDEDDPLWSADWTNEEERGAAVKQLLASTPPRPAEVFELNDTPTWLARLQQRRDQAHRAGKTKLVQKIDKEILEATKAAAFMTPPKESVKKPSRKSSASEKDLDEADCGEDKENQEDVYNMDWTSIEAR
eukprot:TRINITY_DN82609_c0_g1_i1.p1 TRINITY_DN82609_c0_g1~~TRINITY_DN82609_c0_g1_i1.p1  ORF type:complete len:259 (+),score=66.21 TRINITY_DN82609_c0_g1_i1:87-863(+)